AAAVAAISVVLGGGGFAAFSFFAGREVTQLGEVRRITLADGSAMVLNTTSVARIRFDEHERRIVLGKGEASFLVAKHDRRPFIVQARDVSVRAVGTAFVVRVRPTAVSVTVDEGVVEIVRAAVGAQSPERRRLSANRQLTAPVSDPIKMTALSHEEVS